MPTRDVSAAPASEAFRLLMTLVEISGVSGHEGPVRDAIRTFLPDWARPEVDERGNVTMTFGGGGAGAKNVIVLAHMDEIGFEIGEIRADGSASLKAPAGMYLSLFEAHPVIVQAGSRSVPAVILPRREYTSATQSDVGPDPLVAYFGTSTARETEALGVSSGQPVNVPKRFTELAPPRATGRSLDDRAGVAALLLALRQIDPSTVKNRVTFAWTVQEELGALGAVALASRVHADYAFGVDTFVSTDAPLDVQHLAHVKLGSGAVLRGLDGITVVSPETIDRVSTLARRANVPLQLGVTLGAFDSSAFSAWGAIDVGVSWPGRYSHSAVEVLDQRDLQSLARLIVALAQGL